MPGDPDHHQASTQTELIWSPFSPSSAAEGCDLSGHFWATVRPESDAGRTVWSWVIIGYEGQLLAAGQTGNLAVAKRLVEEWNRWVCGPAAVLDSTDNPAAIADDHLTYSPVWPQWEWNPPPPT